MLLPKNSVPFEGLYSSNIQSSHSCNLESTVPLDICTLSKVPVSMTSGQYKYTGVSVPVTRGQYFRIEF